jgi:hypothetical protein
VCVCRQFRDTAHERYFKNMNVAMYFHSSIADYYLGIWGGGNPKPFKYTEIQRHRSCSHCAECLLYYYLLISSLFTSTVTDQNKLLACMDLWT